MQNASLSTLTKSSHKRQQNSLKSKIASFFLSCWCKYVEDSSTNPMKTYAKNGKKIRTQSTKNQNFSCQYLRFSPQVPLHTWNAVSTTLARHFRQKSTDASLGVQKRCEKLQLVLKKNVSSKNHLDMRSAKLSSLTKVPRCREEEKSF